MIMEKILFKYPKSITEQLLKLSNSELNNYENKIFQKNYLLKLQIFMSKNFIFS